MEVLALMTQGKSNKAIGRVLAQQDQPGAEDRANGRRSPGLHPPLDPPVISPGVDARLNRFISGGTTPSVARTVGAGAVRGSGSNQ